MTNPNGTNKDPQKRAPLYDQWSGVTLALGVPTYGKYTAIIVDVSRSGLHLELETPLPTGIEVKVEFDDLVILGEVLNRGSGELGHYRIGVRIREVVRSHEARGLLALDKTGSLSLPVGSVGTS